MSRRILTCVNAEPDQLSKFESALTPQILGIAWRYAHRLSRTPEDAEDLLQDALAHALVRIDQLRNWDRFKSWLMSIVRTRFLMNHRRHALEREKLRLSISDSGERAVDYTATLEGDILADEVAAALGRLPDFQQEVLTLFYLDGMSLAETGDILGITVGAVQQRLFRARGALKRELERGRSGTGCAVLQES